MNHLRFPFGITRSAGIAAREPVYDDYIRQLIRQVLLTAKGERVCRPDFGAGIRRAVFAPLSMGNAAFTRTLVYEALENWLGTLITVEDVVAIADNETLWIEVKYIVIARGERRVLNEEVTL